MDYDYGSMSLFTVKLFFLVQQIFKLFTISFQVTAAQNEGNTGLCNGHHLTKGAELFHPGAGSLLSSHRVTTAAHMAAGFCSAEISETTPCIPSADIRLFFLILPVV